MGWKEEQRGKDMLGSRIVGFDITMLVEKAQKGMKAETWSLLNK